MQITEANAAAYVQTLLACDNPKVTRTRSFVTGGIQAVEVFFFNR